jgi:hypothetical protein
MLVQEAEEADIGEAQKVEAMPARLAVVVALVITILLTCLVLHLQQETMMLLQIQQMLIGELQEHRVQQGLLIPRLILTVNPVKYIL